MARCLVAVPSMFVLSLIGQGFSDRAREVLSIPDGDRRRVALFSLGADWAMQDPAAAADWALSIEGEPSNEFNHAVPEDSEDVALLSAALRSIDNCSAACKGTVSAWFRRDPYAALRWVETIEHWATWTHVCVSIAKIWTAREWKVAIQWAGRLNHDVLAASIGAIARIDPRTALKEAVASGDYTVLAAAIANVDHELLMDWAKSVLNDEYDGWKVSSFNAGGRTTAVSLVAGTLAVSEPGRALRWLSRLKLDGDTRSYIEGVIAEIWARSDLEAGIAYAESFSAAQRVVALGEIAKAEAYRWRHPSRSRQLALSLPREGARDWAIVVNAQQWAREDPAAAEHWFEASIRPESRDFFVSLLAQAMANQDIARSLRLASSISDPVSRDEAVYYRVILEVDSADNFPTLLKALSLIEDVDLRHEAYIRISGLWAESDPEAVVEWLKRQSLPNEILSRSMSRIGVTWAERDLGRGLGVIRSLRAPHARRSGLAGIMLSLASKGLLDAAVEIGKEGPEDLLSQLSVYLAIKNRVQARRIADSIRDDALRESTLQSVGERIRSRQVLFESDF